MNMYEIITILVNDRPMNDVFLLLNQLQLAEDISQELLIFHRFQHSRIENFSEEWLDKYLDYDFFQLFRFQKQTVEDLLSRIDGPDLNIPYSGGGLPVPAYKQLLVTLWWLGKGETLISVGDKFNLSVSTVYCITERIVEKLINLKEAYIKWPTLQEINTVVDNFRRIGGYPGAILIFHL